MDPQTLLAFIQRIIATSPDQRAAQQALTQLREILSVSLGEEGTAMLETALNGVGDDFNTMAHDVSSTEVNDPRILIQAAERAKQQREIREERERYGRC